MIKCGKKMVLFRYSNYRRTDFISEHMDVIQKNGYTWLMKAGKKSDSKKVNKALEESGILILKAPVSCGSTFYVAEFCEFSDNNPKDSVYPEYYTDFLEDMYDINTYQWFKVTSIKELPLYHAEKIVLSNNKKKVIDILQTTRTAFMFVESNETFDL